MLADLGQDVRYGIRMLVRNPVFTGVAVVSLALGARPADVLRLVLLQAMATVGIGAAVGLGAAWAASRGLAPLLIEVGTADPVAFGGTAGLLTAVALLASYLPARRAARTDPIVALRYE